MPGAPPVAAPGIPVSAFGFFPQPLSAVAAISASNSMATINTWSFMRIHSLL